MQERRGDIDAGIAVAALCRLQGETQGLVLVPGDAESLRVEIGQRGEGRRLIFIELQRAHVVERRGHVQPLCGVGERLGCVGKGALFGRDPRTDQHRFEICARQRIVVRLDILGRPRDVVLNALGRIHGRVPAGARATQEN